MRPAQTQKDQGASTPKMIPAFCPKDQNCMQKPEEEIAAVAAEATEAEHAQPLTEEEKLQAQIAEMLAAQRAKVKAETAPRPSSPQPEQKPNPQEETASSLSATTATTPLATIPTTPPTPATLTENIDFPKARVQSGGKLPVRFVMLEKKSVKYMVKNAGGKIVKRGASTLESGASGKGIDVSSLAPGRYRISVKVEEKIVHHTFVILE